MKITRRQLRRIIRESSWGRSEHDAEASGMVASYRQGYSDGYENPRLQATTGRDPEYLRGYEKGAADAEDGRDEAKYIREAEGSTKKYDDDSALKGGQSKLPDGLQKGIIDKTVEDREEREEEEREEKNESFRITRRQLRRIIREAMYQRDDEVLLNAYNAARIEGMKLIAQGKKGSLYVGIGNTEGLHDFAQKLAREKWQQSGNGFVRKLQGLVPGDLIQAVETGRGGRTVSDVGTWTPELGDMVGPLKNAADLEALISGVWD